MTSLRNLRKARGLTLNRVSQDTGIDLGGLSRIERGGQFPGKQTARSLAAFYGISIGDVFDGLAGENDKRAKSAAQ
jgi:transcriptional regulator with XRE-family HTH domain